MQRVNDDALAVIRQSNLPTDDAKKRRGAKGSAGSSGSVAGGDAVLSKRDAAKEKFGGPYQALVKATAALSAIKRHVLATFKRVKAAVSDADATAAAATCDGSQLANTLQALCARLGSRPAVGGHTYCLNDPTYVARGRVLAPTLSIMAVPRPH